MGTNIKKQKLIEKCKKDKYCIIVNKENRYLDCNQFCIIPIVSEYADERYAEKRTYRNWLRLKKYAEKNGFDIEVESGYRSKKIQQEIWDEVLEKKGLEHTKKYVAQPGHSEHQIGLAIDFCLKEGDKFFIEFEMDGSPVLEFIENNCYKFGFILRYKKGKEYITGYNNEPWHLRYVGKKLAKHLFDNDLTLEEFFI
ncbi:MAG: M15 family metallopeptidase [Clostridia bacterium]|nr:M15 family metallopeptidase [Clostridia bacterium]